MIAHLLLQINISNEDSKSGVSLEAAKELLKQTAELKSLEVRGLMSIGTYVDTDASDSERRREFRQMKLLRDELAASSSMPLPELSMGMSHDYELAIEEGATIVRVGTAVFGERS